MEGIDTHGGHGHICEGDRVRVGVSHGMVEVKFLCFRFVPKHRHIIFRHQGITQKKAYNVQNMAKVRNHDFLIFCSL